MLLFIPHFIVFRRKYSSSQDVIKLLCQNFCRNEIESVVGKENLGSDVMCSACQMAVVWIENQLRQNKMKHLVLQYGNQVTAFVQGIEYCEAKGG